MKTQKKNISSNFKTIELYILKALLCNGSKDLPFNDSQKTTILVCPLTPAEA